MKSVRNNSETIKQYARRFLRGHWSFLGPGSEKKWHGIYDGKPDGFLNRTVGEMLLTFAAVADMIEELPIGQRALGKPKAPRQLDKQEIITQPPFAEVQANEERQGNLLQKYEQCDEKLSEDLKLSRLCSEAGLGLVEVRQFFFALQSPSEKRNQFLCKECTMFRDQEGLVSKGGSKAMYDLAQSRA